VNSFALAVVIWLTCGTVGLGLALVGLRGAQLDRRAVLVSGQNGLMDHLARGAVRSWLVRVAVQTTMVVFAVLLATLPPPVLPADAPAAAVLRLYAARWSLCVVSGLLVAQSALDLRDRRQAGRIARGRD